MFKGVAQSLLVIPAAIKSYKLTCLTLAVIALRHLKNGCLQERTCKFTTKIQGYLKWGTAVGCGEGVLLCKMGLSGLYQDLYKYHMPGQVTYVTILTLVTTVH